MSDKQVKHLVVLISAALVAVIGFGAVIGSHSVASRLNDEADDALAAAGLKTVTVDFAGREATVTAGSADELDKAESLIGGIEGVRTVAAAIGSDREADSSAPTLEFRRTASGATISGQLPSKEASSALRNAAVKVFGKKVENDVRVDSRIHSADWVTRLPDLFDDIVGVSGLIIRIDGRGGLELGGAIESSVGRESIAQRVSRTLPGLIIENRIRVRPGSLSVDDALTLTEAAVYFGEDSAELSSNAKSTLNAIVGVLNRNEGLSIRVGGHVDPADREAARRLCKKRTAAVRNYLVARGIRADRVETISYDSDHAETTDSTAGEYRRVDFTAKGN